jgi:hypothetical protein
MPALLPSEILQSTPKISKGEKYEGLPYVVLDYPRCFSIDHVFAIRTFFWWGNYFSSSLHLKGKYQQQFAGKINEAIKKNEFEGCYLSVAGDEFNFNLRNKNYLLIDNTTTFAPYKVMENDFFKISIKIPLQQWNAVPERLTANFLHLISVMTA